MNFSELFLTHLLSSNHLSSALTVSPFLSKDYYLQPDGSDHMLCLMAAGYVKSFYPYRYELMDLPSFCIIYTVKGNGVFEAGQTKLSLCPATFLLIDCRLKHKIYAEKNSWNFYQLFLQDTGCLFFYQQFLKRHGNTAILSQSPYILSLFNRLTAVPAVQKQDSFFINHRLLTDLLTAAILTPFAYSGDSAPSYLRKMKNIMDTQYASSHSLAQFEETTGISRYRLSREFHKFYQAPPLQYLNRRRIEESKILLQNPDMTVYEAGKLVGIDNTTHFIRLFRKYTGTTPGNYKSSLSF